MKTNLKTACVVAFLIATIIPTCVSFAGGVLGAGLRRHSEHSVAEDLPLDDGDLSSGLCYEIHDRKGYWQLGVTYAPQPGTNGIDFVVTPQLNLIVKDKAWRAGVGILDSYVEMEDGESDWTDVYYQFLTGLHFPIGGMQLDVTAYYPFTDWGDISDFDFDDLDYGAWLTFSF